jgi:hypothetical protein
MLEPPIRRDKRGRLIPMRDPLLREMDAMVVSPLAYAGPRPESEALSLAFDQVGRRRITCRATKRGVVVERETRLLEPLARDLRRGRLRCPPTDDGLVFRPRAAGGGPATTGTTRESDSFSRWPPRSVSRRTRAREICAAATRAC